MFMIMRNLTKYISNRLFNRKKVKVQDGWQFSQNLGVVGYIFITILQFWVLNIFLLNKLLANYSVMFFTTKKKLYLDINIVNLTHYHLRYLDSHFYFQYFFALSISNNAWQRKFIPRSSC